MGFSLLKDGALASTSFAAFIVGQQVEVGIETLPEYRGKGLASIPCRAMLDHCIANNLIPKWSCRKDNTGSHKIAEKIGFELVLELPYYSLRKK